MEDRQFCKWTPDPEGGGIAEFAFPDGETTYARFTDFSHFLCLSSSIQHQINMRDQRIAELEEALNTAQDNEKLTQHAAYLARKALKEYYGGNLAFLDDDIFLGVVKLKDRVESLEAALAPFADAAAHIPEEAEMLDVDYMLNGEAGCEPVAFEGIAFHRASALLQEES